MGEFGVDVDGDGAEQANGVGLGRGYVDEEVGVDAAALSVHVVDGQPEILGRPSRDGVGGQGQTPCLLGLLLQVPPLHRAFVGVEHVAFERCVLSPLFNCRDILRRWSSRDK